MKYFFSFILFWTVQTASAQTENFKNDWTSRYISDDLLQIDSVRATVNVLTNYWMFEYQNVALVDRKKAVVRHVKHLSEALEFHASSQRPVNDSIRQILNELEWMKRSYLDKSAREGKSQVTFGDKWQMLKATMLSSHRLQFRISDSSIESTNNDNVWDAVTVLPHKNFGTMADAKKIDRDKQMLVVFKDLSRDGSAPKIKTWDLDFDNGWTLKWGDEVHTDVVGSRLFAALGFDVDHPYFYPENKLTLILDSAGSIQNWQQLHDSICEIYKVDLTPFLSEEKTISMEMAQMNERLTPFIGQTVITFKECSIEARPDRVKRLGSFIPNDDTIAGKMALKRSLLAHIWIDNWDVREQNTLLTTVHDGNYKYKVSAVYSDLGTSFGVHLSPAQGDFKVGLVNEYGWVAAKRKGKKVKLLGRINAWLQPFEDAEYKELKWMATKIASIDSLTLRKILKKSGWPPELKELYFHKLASRRASILEAFEIIDPHPIAFDRKLNWKENGEYAIKRGKLKKKYIDHPESLTHHKGRKRNYGN